MATVTAGVGDLVLIDWHRLTMAGVVEQVHKYMHLDEVVYDVYAVGPGVVCVGPEHIRPVDVPRPKPGQRWVSGDGQHRLEVLEVERGGLVATCRSDKGNVDRFVLVAHYRPEEG